MPLSERKPQGIKPSETTPTFKGYFQTDVVGKTISIKLELYGKYGKGEIGCALAEINTIIHDRISTIPTFEVGRRFTNYYDIMTGESQYQCDILVNSIDGDSIGVFARCINTLMPLDDALIVRPLSDKKIRF